MSTQTEAMFALNSCWQLALQHQRPKPEDSVAEKQQCTFNWGQLLVLSWNDTNSHSSDETHQQCQSAPGLNNNPPNSEHREVKVSKSFFFFCFFFYQKSDHSGPLSKVKITGTWPFSCIKTSLSWIPLTIIELWTRLATFSSWNLTDVFLT